jgi:protein-disulfide isomerase
MVRTAALIAALVACTPKQDTHADETARRLAALEQQLAEQQKQLAKLQENRENTTEMGAVLDAFEDLTARVVKLETKGPAAPHRARPEPDKSSVYSIAVAGSPAIGSPKAKVTIVMAMDFACPYCRKAWGTVDSLRGKYGNDLRVVYKAMIVHPTTATHSALAACAANHQGKFRALAELLWVKSFDARAFDDATIDGLASEAKLDLARYQNDLAGACAQEVKDEQAQLQKLGVNATPTFFINGRYLAGAMPAADFEKLIDEEMAKATTAIKGGVKADRYYEQEIVGKGLKEVRDAGAP